MHKQPPFLKVPRLAFPYCTFTLFETKINFANADDFFIEATVENNVIDSASSKARLHYLSTGG